jgi:CCR4-NOT transcription complex subunit 1
MRLESIVSGQSGDAPPPEAKPKDEPDPSVTKGGGPGPSSSSVDSAAQLPSNIMDSIDAMDDKEGSYLAAQVANSSLLPSKDGKEAPSLASLVNTESLESAAEKYKDFLEPPPLAVEKVLFFMNNVTVVNVDVKVVEIKEKIYPDFLAWFANYIVVRRAAQEPNYHGLYVSLCDKVSQILTPFPL